MCAYLWTWPSIPVKWFNVSGIRRVRAGLLTALTSLFGEFLSAEGMDSLDAAWNCDLHTPKRTFSTFSQNAMNWKLNTSFCLIWKTETWLEESWTYLKHCNADGNAGVVFVISTPSGVRSGCVVVHTGMLTLPGCIPQMCSHVGQLFVLKARMLHLPTERSRKRQRNGDGARAGRLPFILIMFFSHGIHQHHPC